MRKLLLAGLFGVITTMPALAQQKTDDHAGHHAAQPAASTTTTGDLTDGEVRRVDRPGGKLTLRHAEIKSLDMPPMTMVFTVSDKALLDTLKAGDKVKFRAVHEAGTYRVTELKVVVP
jgi:Cu/Ag efflux protein CusF